MNIKDLLGKGYFPKELPPPFTTRDFADKFGLIETAWNCMPTGTRKKYKESKCVNYSIPKVGYSRRNLGIPNPLHQSILSKSICDHWAEIDGVYNGSKISASKPVIDSSGKRAVKNLKTFKEFKKEGLMDSFDKLYEVKTDLSRFYPTIYTHAIPWALHTKEIAKSRRNNSTLLGNILDKNVRWCQSSQTIGIPIGPDTSLIIAEIILCSIDKRLKNEYNFIEGYRYYDDYHLFFSSLEDAEKVFNSLQSLLTDFQLDINEEKTNINKFRIIFDPEWLIQISTFEFRDEVKKQETDIGRFFSLAFQLAKENPKDSVLKYAVKRLQSVRINDENWDFFESLLLKTALTETLALPEVTRILITYENLVNRTKVQKVIERIIELHIPRGHSFEVSWALWLSKTFNLKIKGELSKDIFSSNDVISILIALNLKSKGLIDSCIEIPFLDEFTEDSLFDDKWLLTYESLIKNWITLPDSSPLDASPYFKILKDNNVFFYDETQQIKPLKLEELEGIPYEEEESYVDNLY